MLIFVVLVLLSDTAAAADWPMFGHDPQHTGVAGESVEPPLELLWKFKTNSSSRYSPAISDDTVYIGSDDGYVHALDAATGTEKWEYKVGGCIYSSPAVTGDTLYRRRRSVHPSTMVFIRVECSYWHREMEI